MIYKNSFELNGSGHVPYVMEFGHNSFASSGLTLILIATLLQGSEFNSTTGFDRLTQKMKQSKQSLTDYIEFVKKRFRI